MTLMLYACACYISGDVLLKYVDKDGDLVTITNRSDVQAALTEALKQMDRRLGIIPPIRVQVVPADSKVGGTLTSFIICCRLAAARVCIFASYVFATGSKAG